MPPSYDILFVSSNRFKYGEAAKILRESGIRAGFRRLGLQEIQSDSIKEIAAAKAQDAFARCGRPLIIEDDGLFIDSLGGFPGPYSSYVFGTVGNKGILRLVGTERAARFVSLITYCDKNTTKSFEGAIEGKIARSQRGDGWGYDPIFVPENSAKTFAQLKDKNHISHRYRSLKKFSSWYLHRRESSGR